MTPVLPSPNSYSLVTPGNAFISRKDSFQTRCTILRKCRKQVIPSQRSTIPLSTSVRLFPQYRFGCAIQSKLRTHVVAAIGTDVAVEETDSPIADKDSGEVLETPSDFVETSEVSSKSDASPTTGQSKRSRPARKSDMPPVKNEDLIPGATFAGKVRSIQPFGAFVDFGAFTDGLVHVSRLSDSYVKDVSDVVSVGQEVTVKLVEANTETGRISLTMRESDDSSKIQQQKDLPFGSDKSRAPRKSSPKSNQKRNEVKKTSKFVKGQELEGTVKNLARSGAFISLPEGEEGFLPASEEADEGLGMMGGTSLQAGQEVRVRVLRINRGQVTLTMKTEEDARGLDSAVSQGVIHGATNPFVLAFRSNKDISVFLDEQVKEEKPTEKSVEELQDVNAAVDLVDNAETLEKNEDQESILDDSAQCVDSAVDSIEAEPEASSGMVSPEASTSIADEITEVPPTVDKAEIDEKSELSGEIADQTSSSESLISDEGKKDQIDDLTVKDGVDGQTPVEEDKLISTVESEVEKVATEPEANGGIAISNGQVEATSKAESTTTVVENQIDNTVVNDGAQAESPAEESENSSAPNLEENDNAADLSGQSAVPKQKEAATKDDILEVVENQIDNAVVTDVAQAESLAEESESSSAPNLEKNGNAADLSEQTAAPKQKEAATKASISPALVKQLREETGAGMMDCKKALSEAGGDIVKAQEYLRKKGLASADKKASRTTAEGRIGSYIHDSRIGVLIEVNCETDFVARGDIFKELVEDLAMQVAACPQVQYLVTENVPQEIVNKEREIEMQKEDLLSKPEQIRSKIVDGRIRKRLEDLALLEQPYIKNDKVVVKDWVKQTIATIGENIKVKRFVRYNLGEGLEKKSQDFAADVAAQTTAKPSTPKKEQPPAAEAMEAVEKPATATISAALVKQLREETGAGMMDCKRALSETEGDLEKAREYLIKKGLSSADKKSSRLAAEGRIGSYIHDSRIGVLIEVNCETDFVGRSEKFKELVDDLAMQVVACPQVQYVSVEDIPANIVNKEKELEMQRDDLKSKPENIREKIVEGRVSKRLGELALLEQPFIKNDTILIKDLVKQSVAAIGENIKVRRFVKFTLGEESTGKMDGESTDAGKE